LDDFAWPDEYTQRFGRIPRSSRSGVPKASVSWHAPMIAASRQASPPIYVSTSIETIALDGEKCSDIILQAYRSDAKHGSTQSYGHSTRQITPQQI